MDVEISQANYLNVLDNMQVDTSTKSFSEEATQQVHYIVNVLPNTENSQTVGLTKKQAEALGIVSVDLSNNLKLSMKPPSNSIKNDGETFLNPLGSCENPIELIKDGSTLHTTQNLSAEDLEQIAKALQFESLEVVEEKHVENDPTTFYRVVYPDELNLMPSKPSKKGRRKKQVKIEEPSTEDDEPLPVKKVRTRSGRITRPPQYREKDFKIIDNTQTNQNANSELLNDKQEPFKMDTSKQLDKLELIRPKRSIAPQFLCPKCQKAYLGRNKMLQHLKKYPDHGPIPEYIKVSHTDTWNYLINLSNKSPEGQRATKFCDELVTFLKHLRVLATLFFKRPTELDKDLYFVDKDLSAALGIDSGNYVLDENELLKEIKPILSSVKPKVIENSGNTVTYDSNNVPENAYTLNCNSSNENEPINNVNHNFDQEGDYFEGQDQVQSENSKLLNTNLNVTNELLSPENFLLNSLPTLRTTVHDLILNNVDNVQMTSSSDNNIISDEVMNVDQFVNERFKTFTGSDMELPNPTIDLVGMDLFQFNGS